LAKAFFCGVKVAPVFVNHRKVNKGVNVRKFSAYKFFIKGYGFRLFSN